jgi:toxin YoeB
MSYKIIFSKTAVKDIENIRKYGDKQTLKKLFCLLEELKEHPKAGAGKPKQLTGNRAGQWVRRITSKHRLIYIIKNNTVRVLVLSVVGHYDDK